MKLSNIDCRYLKVELPYLETVYAQGDLQSLELQGKFNDGDSITETINFTGLVNTWDTEMDYNASTIITQIYARNIFTDQLFELLVGTYAVNSSSITTMKQDIASRLSSLLNITGVTQTTTLLPTILEYSITGLPENIVMDSIEYTISGVTDTVYFSFVDSDKYIITNNVIYLTPAFFELTEFTNSVIYLKATVTTTYGDMMWQETCFFLDCTMNEVMLDNIDLDKCSEADVHLLMLHYALTQSSNHDCNCDKMFEVFEYLDENIELEDRNPCGC